MKKTDRIILIEVKEKKQDSDRDNMLTVHELLAYDLGTTEGNIIPRFSFYIVDLEKKLEAIKQPKFKNYENLYFLVNKSPFHVNPYKIKLGTIELIKYDTN